MKKLLFAIAFMTAGSVAVLAQEAQPQSQEPQTPPSQKSAPPAQARIKARIRIKINKLSQQVNYLLTSRHLYKVRIIADGQ